MIALAFVVFLVSVALLGWLLPRFAGMVAATLWERRLARRQQQIDETSLREREVGGGHAYSVTRGGSRQTSSSGRAATFTPRRSATAKQDHGAFRSLSDESGAAIPSTLGVLTVVAFGYIGFLAVRQILRVAGALP